MEDKLIMKEVTKRKILRWIHIAFSIPIFGYIYNPFEPWSVCRRFCNVPFESMDVERPCPSTTYFEEIRKLLA
jgi:rubredoxin